jgi:squalene-associated FAD-dependent desaturase
MKAPSAPTLAPHVVIVGGGLAGLSTAHALATAKLPAGGVPGALRITLLESKRITGGRAGSFSDSASGEPVDYCQHVAMGCCTNLIDLLDQCDLLQYWKRYRELSFHHPGYPPSRFAPAGWLPAPLHLAACISRLRYLTAKQKREVRSGLWRLMRTPSDALSTQTAKQWLQSIGQSEETTRKFWDVILVSALGEATKVVSMRAARKVLIDGFAAARGASDVLVPRAPLSELFGQRLQQKINSLGVEIRCQTAVKRVLVGADSPTALELADGEILAADQIVVTVPWHRLSSLFDDADAETAIPNLRDVEQLGASPITGIHLWLDRPLMSDDHAVMVGTTAQWLFRQPLLKSQPADNTGGYYHQVVISASGSQSWVDQKPLLQDKEKLLQQVVAELRSEFPLSGDFTVLRHRMVTDPKSVFSVSPATEAIRHQTRPALPWLHLAGDWMDTGWPATMESAVISGRTAAQQVLNRLALPAEILIDAGLPYGRLARLMIRQ